MNTNVTKKIAAAIILAAAVFATYANTYKVPFIWDDEVLILKNPNLSGAAGISRAMFDDFYPGTVSGSNFYRPVQTLSFAWDHHWARLDPALYHFTNILLQAAVSILAFFFLFMLTSSLGLSFWSALLFAVHPIHAEAVTYISGRAETLLGIGVLAAMVSAMAGIKRTGWRASLYLCVSLVSFAFALLSKELAVVFPLALIAYFLVMERQRMREPRFVATWVVPFLLVLGAYCLVRLRLFSVLGYKQPSLESVPLLTRLTVIPKAILAYLGILCAPVGLHMSRQMIRPATVLEAGTWWVWLGALCLGWARVLRTHAHRKVAWFLWWWALVFFLPQSGLFPINAFIAEHFIYLSSISFFVVVCYLLRRPRVRKAGALVLAGLAVYFASLTFARNYDWQDPGVFYNKILEVSPLSSQAHNNLGLYYQRKGDYPKALVHYQLALQIKPDTLEARSNLAYLYTEMGNLKEGEKQYLAAVKVAPVPAVAEIHNNLGTVYERQGDLLKAQQEYRLALKINPTLKFTHYNLARIYYSQKEPARAVEEVFIVVAPVTAPAEQAKARQILESFIKEKGCLGTAAFFFNDVGVRFADQGLFSPAMEFFTLAADLQPKYADARFNKGIIYLKRGQKKDAASLMREVLAINPAHSRAREILRVIKDL